MVKKKVQEAARGDGFCPRKRTPMAATARHLAVVASLGRRRRKRTAALKLAYVGSTAEATTLWEMTMITATAMEQPSTATENVVV
jgi:hypothetical protein